MLAYALELTHVNNASTTAKFGQSATAIHLGEDSHVAYEIAQNINTKIEVREDWHGWRT